MGESSEHFFSGSCDFAAGAATVEQIPAATLPEVVFAGRSNVGKSSLINAITNRKALARTSRTPGRTQQINFFNIAGRFMLVDMPGYGFARVSRQQKQDWQDMIYSYLRGRETLRCVFVLVDSRHGLKDSDREMMRALDECAAPYRIVLTKVDEIKKTEREALTAAIQDELKNFTAGHPDIYFTSAEKKEGVDTLRDVIMKVAI